jgi:sugar lactone lactonase YvrE
MFVRRLFATALLVGLIVPTAVTPASGDQFPDSIELPDGFRPEGIAIGKGTTFYVGSIPSGRIFRGDLRTGDGDDFPVPEGRQAIGLAVDNRDRVFVAGGPTGAAYVYDGGTGASLASYQLAEASTFINDVEVTQDAAWFTDSMNAVVYRVPIAPNGALGDQDDVEAVPVTGDFVQQAGFNLNGIEATPNGDTLFVVQTGTGMLFAVDPATGVASTIDLGGGNVERGDGLLLEGTTLYVVQNAFNQVAVVELSPNLSSGEIVDLLTDEDFDVPTTVERFGSSLYLVNARFGTPEPDTATYTVERISIR